MKMKASMLEPQNEKSVSKRHNILNANVENDFVKQNALALSTLALYHAHQGTGCTVAVLPYVFVPTDRSIRGPITAGRLTDA